MENKGEPKVVRIDPTDFSVTSEHVTTYATVEDMLDQFENELTVRDIVSIMGQRAEITFSQAIEVLKQHTEEAQINKLKEILDGKG